MARLFFTTCLFLLIAGHMSAQVNDSQLLISKSNFSFDIWNSGVGDQMDSTTYQYNSDRLVSGFLGWRFYNNNWILAERGIDYVYDEAHHLLSFLFQGADSGGNWNNSLRLTDTYDSLGHQLTHLLEVWDQNTWVVNTQIAYQYDANGRLVAKIDGNGDSRVLYLYTLDGLLSVEVLQYLKNGVWENSNKMDYLYHPNDTTLYGVKKSFWLGAQWWDNFLESYSFDSNGNKIENLVKQLGVNGWENLNLYQYQYDSNNNNTLSTLQFWDNGAWANYNMKSMDYDVYSQISSLSDFYWTGSEWEMSGFSRFHYAEVSPTSSPNLRQVQLFPNPVYQNLTLQGDGLVLATLVDAKGSVVFTQKLTDQAQNNLSVQGISPGMYFLQICDNRGYQTVRSITIEN